MSETSWQSVQSSNVEAVATDDTGALLVRFRSGATYRYPGMADRAQYLIASPSPGEWIARHLRGAGGERL